MAPPASSTPTYRWPETAYSLPDIFSYTELQDHCKKHNIDMLPITNAFPIIETDVREKFWSRTRTEQFLRIDLALWSKKPLRKNEEFVFQILAAQKKNVPYAFLKRDKQKVPHASLKFNRGKDRKMTQKDLDLLRYDAAEVRRRAREENHSGPYELQAPEMPRAKDRTIKISRELTDKIGNHRKKLTAENIDSWCHEWMTIYKEAQEAKDAFPNHRLELLWLSAIATLDPFWGHWQIGKIVDALDARAEKDPRAQNDAVNQEDPGDQTVQDDHLPSMESLIRVFKRCYRNTQELRMFR